MGTITSLLLCLAAIVFLITVGEWHFALKRQEILLTVVTEHLDSIAKAIESELAPPFASQNIRSRLDEIAHDARLLRKLAYDEGDAVAAHRKELEDRAQDSQFNYEHKPAILRD